MRNWGRLTRTALAIAGMGMPALAAVELDPELWPQALSPFEVDAALEARIDTLLARMTLEEKVGQTIQAEIKSISPADVERYNIGSILNGGGSWPGNDRKAKAADWVRLADAYYKASISQAGGRTPIPVLWGTDAVHGVNNVVGATLFPHNIGLGAADDPALLQAIGAATARELRATGLDWTFAPTVAVARDPRWGRTYESYSSDPGRVARLAAAFIAGLQGEAGEGEFLSAGHVLATAKHFIGDGGTMDGRDQGDTQVDEVTLARLHGAGYESAIKAGVQSVMASFSSWNGAKMHGSRYLLTDILKSRMGFDGLVIGDWNGHGQLPGCTNADCPDAFNAGIDLVMVPEDWKAWRETMIAHVRAGRIDVARLDDAVRRILRVKMRAGLFDAGPPSTRLHAADAALTGAPDHRQLAREAARKSLVLLKNKKSLLPLSPGSHILVVGAAADDVAAQAGGWSITWQGTETTPADFPGATTILDGLRAAVETGGGSISYAPDGDYRGKRPDAVIVVFGEKPYAEFQGDLETLDFGARDDLAMAQLEAYGKAGLPTIALFLSGRPLYVTPEINRADAFVAAWLPGTEGSAVADLVIAGNDGRPRHDFTGRLSFPWPARPDAGTIDDYDSEALFPLGYGLDYKSGAEGPDALAEAVRGGAASREIVLYDGRPAAPWQLYVGDAANWRVPANGARTTTGGKKPLVAERANGKRQEDALRLTWLGSDAQVYLQNSGGRSLAAHTAQGAVLAFDLLIEEKVPKRLDLRMQCGWPCEGSIGLAPILKSVPKGEWFPMAIELDCFELAGAKMDKIDSPFMLWGSGKGEVMIAGIRIEPASVDRPPFRCQK